MRVLGKRGHEGQMDVHMRINEPGEHQLPGRINDLGVGWRSVDLLGADGLYAGGDRLEKSTADLEAEERGLSEEKNMASRTF